MALIRWAPRRDLVGLRDTMDRMWEDFLGHGRESTASVWNPDLDIAETTDEYEIAVEAPGLDKKGISLTLQDNVLTIKGEKKQEDTTEDTNYLRCERCWGSFQRSFTLPAPVRADKVGAVYKDGVLRITVPKAEEAKPKQVSIAVK